MKSQAERRAEFGFGRSQCACEECTSNCKFIPGYPVPADIERISRSPGYSNIVTFALENLAVSPGATVMSAEGRVFQIPTLVPRRKPDGGCKFLDGQNRCAIHAVSPFGCFSTDTEAPTPEGWATRGALTEGATVLTFNTATDEMEWQPIKLLGLESLSTFRPVLNYSNGKTKPLLCAFPDFRA